MAREQTIQQAAVLGAGVMGAAIAAHLANAGIPCLLLDIKPKELNEEERSKGLGLDHPAVANRIVKAGFARARKVKPASFFAPQKVKFVQLGNLEDDLEKLRQADWIIEAVVENLEVKKALFRSIEPFLKPSAILTSNTSGLPIAKISATLPEARRARFLGTHFFNPPRYLKLLEVIPGPLTAPEVIQTIARFGEAVLGKGIVYAKDTPNFISNRIGCYAMMHAMHLMVREGYSINEVDQLTGPVIGRPKSATFRTADVVGLDTLMLVAKNSFENLPNDPERDVYCTPPFVESMIERGYLGQKDPQGRRGFYRKIKEGGRSVIQMIDPESLEYIPQKEIHFASLAEVRKQKGLAAKLRFLVNADDRGAQFLWQNLSATMRYAANLIPEISDDLANVDNGVKWGFGWKVGPFEIWDALGVRESCKRMEADGFEIPSNVQAMLETGNESFYRDQDGTTAYFDFGSAQQYRQDAPNPRILRLSALQATDNVVLKSEDAALVDLGDEVACLEFRTKMNTIGPGVIDMIRQSLEQVEQNWRGMVVANEADAFSAGANLAMVLASLQENKFEPVEQLVGQFQAIGQQLRYSSRPVVAGPRGLTLGGGCELSMAADATVAAAETYIGLPEVGAGVIPAGGGCKELLKRLHLQIPDVPGADLQPFVQALFQTVGMGQVATSAHEGIRFGFLRAEDPISMNPDYQIQDAKNLVLAMDRQDYRPSQPLDDIRVVGESGLAVLRSAIHNMVAGGYIGEYGAVIGGQLAYVLCGGELSENARVSESYLLELEKQAFMTLCGDSRTQACMEHILKTGKPLRI